MRSWRRRSRRSSRRSLSRLPPVSRPPSARSTPRRATAWRRSSIWSGTCSARSAMAPTTARAFPPSPRNVRRGLPGADGRAPSRVDRGGASARRARRRDDVRLRCRVEGDGHDHCRRRARARGADDDRAGRHAQRPCHLPRRIDLHAGRQRVRVRLQQLQSHHGGVGLHDRFHRPGARRRRAHGGRSGAKRQRPHRRLRHRSAEPARRADRVLSRQVVSHQGSCDRTGVGGGMPARKPAPGDLEPIETASRDELQATQLKRLQWTLRHAYDHVPHYRGVFDGAGFHPNDLGSLSDLARLPFTTKKELRDNYPFGMFAVPRDQVVRIHASSGTTGKPTVVGYTRNDIEIWATVMARSIRAAGGRAGDLVHVAYGYGLFTGGLGAHYGAEKLGCTVIPMSGGMTERQVQLIADFRPDIIMVTPSYMLAIAEEMERQHYDPRKSSLSIGIFGAEPWTPTMREAIEARLDIDAIDIYGLSEVIGPGVAQECIETKDGLTIWEDHFYPEIIDPESGRVLPEGEQGELVLTSLTKEALPVIRYRTRDLTRLLPPTARSMRRIEKITGRSDDMLIIRGVNVFPTQIEELILEERALAPHYQLEIARPRTLDELTVLVERVVGVGHADGETAGATLAHRIKNLIGVTASVQVVQSGGIERSLGKAKRIIDKRPKG